jgi:hypothetical protein
VNSRFLAQNGNHIQTVLVLLGAALTYYYCVPILTNVHKAIPAETKVTARDDVNSGLESQVEPVREMSTLRPDWQVF